MVLDNAGHERFAQALVAGKSAVDAYEVAGHRRNRGHASTLRRDPKILRRVDEVLETRGQIQSRGALAAIEHARLTKSAVIEMLLADRELARRNGQSSAATRAVELLGKELGMFIDRAEVHSTIETRIAAMTREQRLAYAWELLEGARMYLPAAERGGDTIDGESATDGDSVEVEPDD